MTENETHIDKHGNRLFWQGTGWYASCQDNDNKHIATYLVPGGLAEDGATTDNEPDAYRHGLGYPYWLGCSNDWLNAYS